MAADLITGLKLQWDFLEGSGLTVADGSGSGHTGAFASPPEWLPGGGVTVSTTAGGAIENTDSIIANATNFSFMGWLSAISKPADGVGNHIFDNYGDLDFLWNSTGLYMRDEINGGDSDPAQLPADGAWHSFAFTNASATLGALKIYVDGALTVTDSGITDNGFPDGFTSHISSTISFYGLRLYQGIKTDEDVAAFHARGVGDRTPTDIQLSNSKITNLTDTTGGITVGILSTSDRDANDTFTYTIVGGADQAVFSIVAATLEIDAGIVDWGTKHSYVVIVRSTDAGGLYVERQFVVRITIPRPTSLATAVNRRAEMMWNPLGF